MAVRPEHFGIVAIDCAKARSRFFLTDFFGKVLLEPATLQHTRGNFQAAIERIRQAMQEHHLNDLVVALECTGQYHRVPQRAFRDAGFDIRLVHALTSKQYRLPADPGYKTDDTDVAAIFRAVTQGFGLVEPVWPDDDARLQLLRRHRRDLVDKNAALQCQIREVLHQLMPGYAECFSHLWETPAPMTLARKTGSAQAVLQRGGAGMAQLLRDANVAHQRATLDKAFVWAQQAPPALPADQPLAAAWRRKLDELDDDRLLKIQQILSLERDLASLIVKTPYALLLAIPGINVVSVADLAGEMGPIRFYPNPNAITGRAGLHPCRYQSDQVDRPDGPLAPRGNRHLRAVLMQTADNLVQHNNHFRALAGQWIRQGKRPVWIRVKVAKIFSRIAFAMVAGRQIFPHPCCQQRHYLLGKLLSFHTDHRTAPDQIREDLLALSQLVPESRRAEEARPLQDQLQSLARRRGPQPLANIIPLVLARLGVIQSDACGEEPR